MRTTVSYFSGHTSADYGENQYTAGILAGYDHPFGNVTHRSSSRLRFLTREL